MRRILVAPVVLVLAGFTARSQPPGMSVADVLQRAANYLDEYERTVGSVVATEQYRQTWAFSAGSVLRVLRSDMVFIRDERFGWVEYRDVAESDGRRVRDREERLLALFLKPHADRLSQAQRIVEEGARFNLNPTGYKFTRTINLPLTPLRFLRRQDQHRSSFQIPPQRQDDTVEVEFVEQGMPRLIQTPDQRAARGRFSIERTTGRVMDATVTARTATTTATITVTFAKDGKLGLWLPRRMDERYTGPFVGAISGVAEYADFRQFRVDTSYEVGKEPPK